MTRITGSTITGVVFLMTGCGIIIVQAVRNGDSNVVLSIAVGCMVFGAHLISATAVRGALKDIGGALGKLWPGRKQDGGDG